MQGAESVLSENEKPSAGRRRSGHGQAAAPDHDERRRLARYVVISVATGAFDYLLALALLHNGFSPPASLACSIAAAGVMQYFALEWWGFPGRKSSFSWKRLAGCGVAEVGTYLVRLAVLTGWRLFFTTGLVDNILGLALAYATAFLVGYVVRSRLVFANGRAV